MYLLFFLLVWTYRGVIGQRLGLYRKKRKKHIDTRAGERQNADITHRKKNHRRHSDLKALTINDLSYTFCRVSEPSSLYDKFHQIYTGRPSIRKTCPTHEGQYVKITLKKKIKKRHELLRWLIRKIQHICQVLEKRAIKKKKKKKKAKKRSMYECNHDYSSKNRKIQKKHMYK